MDNSSHTLQLSQWWMNAIDTSSKLLDLKKTHTINWMIHAKNCDESDVADSMHCDDMKNPFTEAYTNL